MHEHLMGVCPHLQRKNNSWEKQFGKHVFGWKGAKALAQSHHVFFCHQAAAAHN
jgi:hypothetical protein